MAATLRAPGVYTTETDLTSFAAGANLSTCGFVLEANWGPAFEPNIITSASALKSVYGTANLGNQQDYNAIKSYISYSAAAVVVRTCSHSSLNASAINANGANNIYIPNKSVQATLNSASYNAQGFIAKYPGKLGNSISIIVADASTYDAMPQQFKSLFTVAPTTTNKLASLGGYNDEVNIAIYDSLGEFTGIVGGVLETYQGLSKASDSVDVDNVPNYWKQVLNTKSQYVYVTNPDLTVAPFIPYTAGSKLTSIAVTNGGTGYTQATTISIVDTANPGNASAKAIPIVTNGVITSVIVYSPGVSYASATTTITVNGAGTGAVLVPTFTAITGSVNDGAKSVISGVPSNFASLPIGGYVFNMSGGVDSAVTALADITSAYDLFTVQDSVYYPEFIVTCQSNSEANYIPTVQYIVDNVIAVNNTQICYASVPLSALQGQTQQQALNAITLFTKVLQRSSSYLFVDCGWKNTYDSDSGNVIPIAMAADSAGLTAETIATTGSYWSSPAGYNRGQVKNITSLVFSPIGATRTALVAIRVNPYITTTTDGTILMGDRMLLGKESSSGFINVRLLLNTLKINIANILKYVLFETNNVRTRQKAVLDVTPLLRFVADRSGVYAYAVICDGSNNTADVINAGNFAITIALQPARSIQAIDLSFVIAPTGTSFTEVYGVNAGQV